jgi:hypothetical protein
MNRTKPIFLLSIFAAVLPGVGPAQTDPSRSSAESIERLRRDQEEILRRGERLQAMMQRLQQRYERENKPEQVRLLQEGLAHLQRAGLLDDIAAIRDNLAATALAEAVRRQREVVEDLERLLNILLDRKSLENLDQELAQAAAQARTARELEQRQRALRDATREALRPPPSPAEAALQDQLQRLAAGERTEANRNRLQAGSRRPFLESALDAVRGLLREQQRLEQGLADAAAGRTTAARARDFDLGDLLARARELDVDLRDQQRTAELGDAARELAREAAGGDDNALQQTRDRFEAATQHAPKVPAGPEGKQRDAAWAALRAEAQQAAGLPRQEQREALQRIGAAGEQLAEQRHAAAAADNAAAGERLRDAAQALARRMQDGAAPQPAADDPAAAVAEAAQHLAEAAAASRRRDLAEARSQANAAIAALERARTAHQQQNPDVDRQAARMAATAAATANELQNAPSSGEAEQAAAASLQQAEQAMREVGRAGDRTDAATAGERTAAAARSREQLEAAQRTLEQALAAANASGQPELEAAAARQSELNAAAEELAAAMRKAAEQGGLTPAQADAASRRLQQARASMQAATERLRAGQQASAANEQQQAADALQQAMNELADNRTPGAEQQQELARQARVQQRLAEDIVRLAEELQRRQNQAAQRHAQAAAEAARRAQQAMERGDAEQTQRQQETARQQLEDAARELEEEQERYRDLRQEELLFRMRDELTTLLDKQRPITQETQQAAQLAQASPAEGLPRASRRKMNQLSEEEAELARRVDTLVQALTDEGNLVYRTVLIANAEDLREVARRLAGRNPDVSNLTTLMQQDVERRTEELLQALERERQRREEERRERQQQQQSPQGQNRFSPQRQKLVSLIAELEMLKRLGTDARRTADNLQRLIEARGDETVTDAEVALIERLGHRHAEVTRLFQQIRSGIEEMLQAMQNQEGEEGGRGR